MEWENEHQGPSKHQGTCKCRLCDSVDHFVQTCPWLGRARTLLVKYKKVARDRAKSKAVSFSKERSVSRDHQERSSSRSYQTKLPSKASAKPALKKESGHVANDDNSGSDSEYFSIQPSDDTDDEAEAEIVMLSKELISKASLSTWPADTGASLYISDQHSLFR